MKIFYIGSKNCVPCKMMKPVVNKINEERSNIVEYIDTDENSEIVHQFGITNVPTFVKTVDGQELDRFVGVKNIKDFREWINE